MTPPVFHISPDWCGQQRIGQMFRQNGLMAVCHEDGRLAEDLAHAHAAGVPPLTPWPGAALFSGLHRQHRLDRAPLEGWRLFAWLDAQFPGARFILTTRDPAGWIADRLCREGGRVACAYARHLDCPITDLPDL